MPSPRRVAAVFQYPTAAEANGLRWAALLQIAAALLWIPQAGSLGVAVGRIAAGQPASAVLWPAAIVLVLGIAKAALDACGQRLAFRHARGVLSDRRAQVAAALAARSPLDTSRPPSGLAASVLTEQAEAIVAYLARFRPARLRAAMVPLVIWLCVFSVSWLAALVLLVAAPLIPIFMALIGWRAKAAAERQLGEIGNMNAFLLDRLRGLATIRAFGAVEATATRVRAEGESLRARTMAVLRIAFLSSAVLELFAALGVAMVAVYVGFHLLGQLNFGAWNGRLSLGEALFVLLLAPAFFEPLRELSSAWHDRASGEAALDALTRLGEGKAELLGASTASAPEPCRMPPSVRIHALDYGYPTRNAPVFEGLSLAVAPGEHVALLAPSGAGKSTLLALIAGFDAPASGRIVIGDTMLTEQTAAGLRRRIAWIGQAPHIFAGTLASNISLGRPQIGPDKVHKTLDRMHLGHIRRRGTTAIGEGGTGLSGGEALRLALARAAVLPDATLVLADEPTAHLDSATAEDITTALLDFSRGRTLLVATHDPVLAARMDRIIRLDALPMEAAA